MYFIVLVSTQSFGLKIPKTKYFTNPLHIPLAQFMGGSLSSLAYQIPFEPMFCRGCDTFSKTFNSDLPKAWGLMRPRKKTNGLTFHGPYVGCLRFREPFFLMVFQKESTQKLGIRSSSPTNSLNNKTGPLFFIVQIKLLAKSVLQFSHGKPGAWGVGTSLKLEVLRRVWSLAF